MNNSLSLQQISRTGNLDPNLIPRQNKLALLSKFMCIKFENPKIKQSEIANQLGYSTSTSQRYRNDTNMLSPYRIHPNNTNKRVKKGENTNFDNNSHRDPDPKRHQMTSNDLNVTSNETVKNEKNKLKGGANIEINEHYLDEILHNINSSMELATQIISTDKTVRKDTIQDLKEFNSQFLTTQARKGEQLISLMPSFKKAFRLMRDDIVELSVENESLKSQIAEYDEKWLQNQSKAIKRN